MWQRSVEFDFRYTQMLTDGDSQAFNVVNGMVYGVEKLDCINHAHKWMGAALRNVWKLTRKLEDGVWVNQQITYVFNFKMFIRGQSFLTWQRGRMQWGILFGQHFFIQFPQTMRHITSAAQQERTPGAFGNKHWPMERSLPVMRIMSAPSIYAMMWPRNSSQFINVSAVSLVETHDAWWHTEPNQMFQ